jgi:TldD protein
MLLPHLPSCMPHFSTASPQRQPRPQRIRAVWFLSLAILAVPALNPVWARAQEAAAGEPVLLNAMTTELHRAFTMLGRQNPVLTDASAGQMPPYFISYTVTDSDSATIRAQFGGIVGDAVNHFRVADVQVRVGSPTLDNTHGDRRGAAVNTIQLPLGDDREALMRTLWLATNNGYGSAIENFLQVKTNVQVRAKEEDDSPDFSRQAPQAHIGAAAPPVAVDRAAWEERLRAVSQVFRDYPEVYQNLAVLTVQNQTEYFASSEGSRIVMPHMQARIVLIAATRADDGMELFRDQTFEARTADGLPSQAALQAAARQLGESLEALRKAPVTEPFDGPALLSGRAAAVFFHEVLGHRLEGQRQRGDNEGQTFTKDIGKQVLPSFISVVDDPTVESFGSTWLSGSYQYDDEGQKAQRVDLIDDGVLKSFLMSRLPIANFSTSNGHGRAEPGHIPTGRQGNLIVSSTKMKPEAALRKQLIAEAKKQGKPYGLYFEDISSGFAITSRSSPQAFQVIPLVVWRVYVDGRPDELVRGVSIVGTPLAAMKSILATGDKSEVFNGICGAESGSVPVSAVAPAILLSQLETQRQPQDSERPPILPIPGAHAPLVPTKEAQ